MGTNNVMGLMEDYYITALKVIPDVTE